MPNTPRIVLIACLLLLAARGHAQAPAAGRSPAADETAEAANPTEGAEAPPDAAPAAPENESEAGSTPPDRAGTANRQLKAGGEEFGVQVLPITGGPAQGALVLVPGDGRRPMSSRGIADLQMGMRAFGWSTWLPELHSPPQIHAASMNPVTADTTAPSAAPAGTPPAEPAPGQPAPGEQATAEATAAGTASAQDASTDGPAETPSLEADRALERQEWSEHSRARLAAVVAEAAGEGRVVLVAEGTAAALLTGLAADQPSAPFALVLLDPVELPGLSATWPKGSAIPVLEVFDHSAERSRITARRVQARADGLHSYRQTMLSLDGPANADAESLLARRLRGWLSTLDQQGGR